MSSQKAEIGYDATVYFCNRFFSKRDRTHDQMVQVARSGKQNIVEGSEASGTSKETEIKLTSVARASLEELLTDNRDFLRIRGLIEWTLDLLTYAVSVLSIVTQGQITRRSVKALNTLIPQSAPMSSSG